MLCLSEFDDYYGIDDCIGQKRNQKTDVTGGFGIGLNKQIENGVIDYCNIQRRNGAGKEYFYLLFYKDDKVTDCYGADAVHKTRAEAPCKCKAEVDILKILREDDKIFKDCKAHADGKRCRDNIFFVIRKDNRKEKNGQSLDNLFGNGGDVCCEIYQRHIRKPQNKPVDFAHEKTAEHTRKHKQHNFS